MAVVVIGFSDIDGESTVAGFEDKVDAVGLRESLEVAASSGGRTRSARTVGQSKHSDIELTRFKDIASPKLAEACSSGRNLSEVTIDLFRTLETGLVSYMTYTLTDVFVSRIEQETLDEQGVALQPHLSESMNIAPPPSYGAVGIVFSSLRELKGSRAAVRSISWQPRSSYSNLEVERVLLNAATVTWTYNQFTGGRQTGSIVKGWNIQKGIEV